jgi:hypothetical protein
MHIAEILKFLGYGAMCLVLSCSTFGCTPGKRPFLMVQMCLQDERELADLTRIMKSIAESNGLTFVDRSQETKAELNEIRKSAPNTPIATLNIGTIDPDGVGFSAGNLGMGSTEVVVGFSEGSNSSKAHLLADTVVKELQLHWKLETVPSDKGAFPNPNCRSHS